MAKNIDFMVSTIRVSIPAPATLPALGKLAEEYAAKLAEFQAWVETAGGSVKATEPETVTRRAGEVG